jgi:dienelactone hydrolase
MNVTVPTPAGEIAAHSHSFLNHHDGRLAILDRITGIGYDAPAADDAWPRILAFFARNLMSATPV